MFVERGRCAAHQAASPAKSALRSGRGYAPDRCEFVDPRHEPIEVRAPLRDRRMRRGRAMRLASAGGAAPQLLDFEEQQVDGRQLVADFDGQPPPFSQRCWTSAEERPQDGSSWDIARLPRGVLIPGERIGEEGRSHPGSRQATRAMIGSASTSCSSPALERQQIARQVAAVDGRDVGRRQWRRASACRTSCRNVRDTAGIREQRARTSVPAGPRARRR